MMPKVKNPGPLFRLCIAIVMAAGSILAQAEQVAKSSVNMSPGATEVSHQVYDLHMYALVVCAVIGAVVFGVMFYSIFTHRKSRGVIPATFHESTRLEILWTVVPFALLIAVAFPATKTLLNIYNTEDADLDIMVTGYQWKWKYEYLGEDVSFFSNLTTSRDEIENRAPKSENYLLEVDNPLVIPAGKKVRFLLTSADVIHSWWVPDLAVKKDAIPGFITESWTSVPEPAVYRGQCTELCGKDHGFMPVVVNVVEPAEFDGWLAERKEESAKERELMSQVFNLDQLMERGESVYLKNCASCHLPNGQGLPPAFPGLVGSAIALGPVADHLDMVVNGKPGTAMAAYGGQLSEVDMAAVVTYERNAWGNNVGDLVQPIDVANFKKSQ